MPYHKASSGLNLNKVKFKTSKIIKSSLTTSLIAGIFSLPSLGKPAQAEPSIENNTSNRNFSAETNVKVKQSKADPLSPNTFNPVASVRTLIANLASLPLKSQDLANTVSNKANVRSSSAFIKSETASFNRLPQPILVSQAIAVEPEFSQTLSAFQAQPRVHIVGRGDTVSKIARKYGVSKDELVRLNQLKNSNVIFVSQRLEIPTAETTSAKSDRSKNVQQPTSFIPVETPIEERSKAIDSSKLNSNRPSWEDDPHIAKLKADIEQLRTQRQNRLQRPNLPSQRESQSSKTVKDVRSVSPRVDVATSTNLQDSIPEQALALQLPPLPPSEAYLPTAFDGYIWPAQGVLTSGYGWRWGRMHNGIDIAAPIGTPIVAAASGVVINVGWHSGYGNLVRLKHLDGSVTTYAHNHRNLVSHGQKVSQGEQIAEMGNTGHSTGSHLHFEIHLPDKAAVNPLALLGGK